MANEQSGIKFFVILTLLCLLGTPSLGDDEEGGNPVLEAVQKYLEDTTKGQNGGSGINILGNVLQGALKGGAGDQLGQLAAMLSSGGANDKKANEAINLAAGLSSLLNAAKTVTQPKDESGGGGFDPAVLGTMFQLYSAMNQGSGSSNSIEGEETQEKARVNTNSDSGAGWESMLGMAGNLLSSFQEQGRADGSNPIADNLMTFLPMIMSAFSGAHQPHGNTGVPHHTHPSFLPPFLETIHEYWDYFTSNGMGQMLYKKSGLGAILRKFEDESGNFKAEKLFESLENNIYRRELIKGIANFVAEWAEHFSDAGTHEKYLKTAQVLANNFVLSSGYPKKALLSLEKPGESISALVDEVFKRQFNQKVESAAYVKPAISYMQAIFTATKKNGVLNWITASGVEGKLKSTLDTELIEPILRANRAYRFALRNKKCAHYVICVLNDSETDSSQIALKPAVTKVSSMAAAWYLSSDTGISFWELYGAGGDSSCSELDRGCALFHEEDSKATTEYYHNEL